MPLGSLLTILDNSSLSMFAAIGFTTPSPSEPRISYYDIPWLTHSILVANIILPTHLLLSFRQACNAGGDGVPRVERSMVASGPPPRHDPAQSCARSSGHRPGRSAHALLTVPHRLRVGPAQRLAVLCVAIRHLPQIKHTYLDTSDPFQSSLPRLLRTTSMFARKTNRVPCSSLFVTTLKA